MKNKKAIVAILCAMFIFASAGYCGGANFRGINPSSSVSVGEAIYFNSAFGNDRGMSWGEMVNCDYDGFENNAIKITVTTNNSLAGGNQVQHLALPLNDKKQTLLKVPAPGRLFPEKTLLITVVDEFYRIKVEEFKG